MKNSKLLAILCFLAIGSLALPSYASQIDILVENLVDKGVLTHGEAQQILTETKEEMRAELAQGKVEFLPSWVQGMKVGGDLRLRYQWEEKTGSEDRNRGRYRFRLGMEGKVNDKLKAAAGLATGGTDPRSTNQTMHNSFETPDIRLDYAYALWDINPQFMMEGGKMQGVKKLLFRPSDLLWDSDIHPEGGQLNFKTKVDSLDLFINNGFWVLDEIKTSSHDPFMFVIQPGFKYKFNGNTHLKAALAYYGFENVQGSALDHSGGTNTLTSSNVLKYDYDAVAPSVELGIKEPFGDVIPYLAIFGDYIYADDPGDNNKGWLAGVKFGDEKIKDFGHWQLKYQYRELEKDAWLDTFPDSDTYGGITDVKGHEVVLAFGLGKNTELNIDYYHSERISSSKEQDLVQVDWIMKF